MNMKIRRLCSLLLVLVMAFGLIPVDASAIGVPLSGTCGPDLTWSLNWSEGILTIRGYGPMEDYANYPDQDRAPWAVLRISTVVLPDGITHIGDYAFEQQWRLTSITIPDSVRSIGESAFWRCESLRSVTIPDSVTSIKEEAFAFCESLTSITLPDSNVSIGKKAFHKTGLTSITIPDSVTTIGEEAFLECKALTSVTIPDSVTSIGRAAFSGCEALTSAAIPDSITSIKEETFSDCRALTSVTIPDSVSSIESGAFYNCRSLESINIPSSVTSIGANAFNTCYSLESVAIPDSVTSIGVGAFASCHSLESVTIPDTVTTIEDATFRGCLALPSVTIPDSVTSVGKEAFSYCESLRSVTIPDSVTAIEEGAFSNCTALTSVTIPASVTSIGKEAFDRCSSLTSITFMGDAPSIDQAGSGVFSDVTATAYYPADKDWEEEDFRDYGGEITWVSYGESEPPAEENLIAGTWTTDLVMPAADLGVSAPDSVLRATLTFGEDGSASCTWEAVDLTAFRIFFHDMFVNAYYAMAYGAGITDLAEIERFCMESTGLSVSDYMDTLVTDQAMIESFTPASTSGTYSYNADHSAIFTDLAIMEVPSDPSVENSFVLGGNTLYLNAASWDKPDYTFVCTAR